MQIELVRATVADAQELWLMQKEGFAALLEKYQDFESNPAAESIDKTILRLQQPYRDFYFIIADGENVGAISVRTAPDGWKKLGRL